MIFNPNDYSVVFLSYDEPNCEENYQHLISIHPNTLRVHGIKGSDTAHKECARLSKTQNVIIVDGDNFVKPEFFTKTINLRDEYNLSNSVLSYSGLNTINGNQYGNGGIKVWPITKLLEMKTHENSTDPKSIDFSWRDYLQLNIAGSELHINASPKQAWRAGLREGVKLCLENDIPVTDISKIDCKNYDRLWRWMHIGSDVHNGIWAIYGARLAVYMTLVEKWDYTQIKNFEFLEEFFTACTGQITDDIVTKECNRLVSLIRSKIKFTQLDNVYSPEDSKSFRETVKPILRSPEKFIRYKYYPPYDVVFISYNEPNADKNYELLKQKCPDAKRINGIKGIHHAHIEAAKICESDYFWVVDADAVIADDFEFVFNREFYEQDCVRVWRSKNPVNDLIYGYGGVKLLPRMATIRMDLKNIDMTTSICDNYQPIMKVSNTTEFNIDSYSSWRSAFRESAKLASQVISNQVNDETNKRLNIWCTIGLDKPYGKYVLDGAKAGKEYGLKNKNNKNALNLLNDYDWLKEQYDKFY